MSEADLDPESAASLEALDQELQEGFIQTCEESLSPQTLKMYEGIHKRFINFVGINKKRKRAQNARCEATMKENEVFYTIYLLI
jgi:hypothetical protein